MGVKQFFLAIVSIVFVTNANSLRPQFPSLNVREVCQGLFFEPRPLPENDQFFIGCIKGEGVILQCETGKIFKPDIMKCDTKEIVTTTEIPNYDELCRDLNFQFIEHPTDCGKLLFCFNGQAFPRECSPNTIFDISIEQCRPGDRETCEFYETTTVPNLDSLCDGLDQVFLEYPNNCQKAIFCFNSRAIVSTCRENTIFDIEIGDCRPGNPYTCEFDPNDYDVLCKGRFHEFISHPTNCARVIFCHNEIALLRDCPSGTIFDLANGICRPGSPITCDFYDVKTPTQSENDLKLLLKGYQSNYIKKHPTVFDKEQH